MCMRQLNIAGPDAAVSLLSTPYCHYRVYCPLADDRLLKLLGLHKYFLKSFWV